MNKPIQNGTTTFIEEQLSREERLVDAAIKEETFRHHTELRLEVGTDDIYTYHTWKITPKNKNAASISVYGVDENTINLSVDGIYWLEMYMNEKNWDGNIKYFRKYLQAVMEGRIVGWHDKHAEPKAAHKTILEVKIDEGKPERWTGNIFFSRSFKKKEDTVLRNYEPY